MQRRRYWLCEVGAGLLGRELGASVDEARGKVLVRPGPDLADACADEDDDDDGVPDGLDNCTVDFNPDQNDVNGDGIGDLCQNDDDYDGVLNAEDNCAWLPNHDQADRDLDGLGDVCDDCADDPDIGFVDGSGDAWP